MVEETVVIWEATKLCLFPTGVPPLHRHRERSQEIGRRQIVRQSTSNYHVVVPLSQSMHHFLFSS